MDGEAKMAMVRAMIDRSTSGDLEGTLALLHPEMVFREAEGLPYPGDFVGHEGFLRLVKECAAAYALHVDGYELAYDGERVIAQMQLSATSNRSGRVLKTAVTEFYSFRDGLIADGDIYYKDSRAMWELATAG